MNNDESMIPMFSQYFVILLRIVIDRLPSYFRLPNYLIIWRKKKKKKKKKKKECWSDPLALCYRSSGVVNSFTQEQHLRHIRVSVTLSRFHQNSVAIHQFKRYTVRARFWKKTIKKEVSSNIDFRAVWRFFQHPAFLSFPKSQGKWHDSMKLASCNH